MNTKRHIIIGSSAAGIGVLSRLRKLDSDSEIICITAQKQMPYNTCLLADYLGKSKERGDIATKKIDFFIEHNIVLKNETRLVSIDAENQTITCQSKGEQEELSYGNLFLGLGTKITFPSIPSINDYAGVFPFHTLQDTDNILSYIQERNVTKAVVIGAGLSGIECADALSEHGVEIDIVEIQDFLLPSLVDQEGAQFIEQSMNKHNVTMHASRKVVLVRGGDNGVTQVVLDNGKELACDMIIVATGGKPCSDIAQNAGLKIQDGRIVVNEFQQTSLKNIYAGGDVCLVKDIITKELVPSSLWTDAMMQGMHAACAMAGKPRSYPGVCIITGSRFFDTMFVSAGKVICDSNDYQEIIDESDEYYHKFMLDSQSRLCGFLMIGKAKALGKLRSMMLSRAAVSAEDFFALQ